MLQSIGLGANFQQFSGRDSLQEIPRIHCEYPLGWFHWASNGNPLNWMQYDGPNIIEERNSGGITRRYVHGPGTDELIVWYEGGSTIDKRFLQAEAASPRIPMAKEV